MEALHSGSTFHISESVYECLNKRKELEDQKGDDEGNDKDIAPLCITPGKLILIKPFVFHDPIPPMTTPNNIINQRVNCLLG